MKEIIRGSKIISFCKNLNKNLLLFFFNSKTYKFFLALNRFFKNVILKNRTQSLFVKTAKKLTKSIAVKDIGLFIVLVTLFNTLAMFVLNRQIDIFSISARMFFFLLGIFLIFKRR